MREAETGTHLELESNAIRLRNVKELGELLPDVVDLGDLVFAPQPQLCPVDLALQADYGASDPIALVELLTDEGRGEPLLVAIEEPGVVLRGGGPLAAARVCLVLPHGLDTQRKEAVVRVAIKLGQRRGPVEVPTGQFDRVEPVSRRPVKRRGQGLAPGSS